MNQSIPDKPIEVIDAKNWVGNYTFSHKSKVYSIDSIQSLWPLYGSKNINFAVTNYYTFRVFMQSGETLHYKASALYTHSKKMLALDRCLQLLRKQTFKQRSQQYLKSFESNGYFQYYDYLIYDNGDIKHKTKSINIAQAALDQSAEVGRKSSAGFRYSQYTPDEIWIYKRRKGKLFSEHIVIKLKKDKDIILALIDQLSQIKGGQLEYIKG